MVYFWRYIICPYFCFCCSDEFWGELSSLIPMHRFFQSLYISYWSSGQYGPIDHYSTGVKIFSCILSDNLVLSGSTGLFNSVLCVSQWNFFWQKKIMRLCLSNRVRPGREWFPSPLGDFNRLLEGLIGELFQYDIEICFIYFKWHQYVP